MLIISKIFPKKFFQNFQKIELWSPVKGSRVIFGQKSVAELGQKHW